MIRRARHAGVDRYGTQAVHRFPLSAAPGQNMKVHEIASIVNSTTDLCVDVDHIPAGCTSVVEPLDVAVMDPIKQYLRSSFCDQ